uniref:Transposon protein, putative, CACTA, En/Spm sub-class n=2 Tax=Oryza sativa subsp. japonica TaxID=39947 RepID=Q53N06_ORYSJ|nr:transposon protein, putative, CACTA, En/Spm sub-class [Oryza sativa Japonica Group]ABA92439.1 transposon protein, putative, CACTA, En/Spm sub-class [Oryza sativa Japonica Group]
MSILKGYVRNRAHPEGSMIEGYTTEEVVECCIDYLKDGKAIGLPVPRHEGRISGKGTKEKKRIHDNDYKKVKDAHFTVLQQLAIVEPYIEQHLHELQATNVGRSNAWIMKKHKHHFTEWFKKDIVISGKQRILGVDDVKDVEAYNQYENMTLFTDFRNKILRVKESIGESPKPYMRNEGVGKSVRC